MNVDYVDDYETVERKVSELSGDDLNWAVAVAAGWKFGRVNGSRWISAFNADGNYEADMDEFYPGHNWDQASEFIEECKIGVAFDGSIWCATASTDDYPSAFTFRNGHGDIEGSTFLEAAMRAYVRHKCGPTVMIPL